ncbi:DNA translocase FtsK [Macrococcus carouselicus]|uniref:DNA translocase FtsK n=1 Tax=Macrococcus carouselicus TaxID=69969 RepID=A0A9Q8FNU0_9STAP|nr:DNA translocase FtsK [Macrococcus carouselicus]TDM04115.1 DNA translocase FtsK [Macrococcus carouselicus]
MAIKKRKPRTSSKRKTKKKESQPYIYLIALILLSLLVAGIFQFGLIGLGIDCMMIVLTGSARYYTYLLLVLTIIYFTVNRRFMTLNRRLTGWLVLQIALCMLFELGMRLAGSQVKPQFNQIFEQESDSHFHFQGGGSTGYFLESLSSTLISPVGSFVLSLVLFGMASCLIAGRSIRQEAGNLFMLMLKASAVVKEKYAERKAALPKDVTDLPEISAPVHHETQAENVIERDSTVETEHDAADEVPVYEPVRKMDQPAPEEKLPASEPVAELFAEENTDYQLPPLTLLDSPKQSVKADTKAVKQRGQLLENTLRNFGVDAKVSQIRIGPAVTQYEVHPALGVKVSRIVNLSNDIALALAAKDIRIEAPIPGKSAVGIEVPNSATSMVTLREVLEEEPAPANKLKVVLGRNISGDAVTAELNKMPHLLVAGSTGSGKSVCINGIITSILMNAKPHEVKLMMIDPKMVELNVYNGIPHLLTPVVTNPQKASQALQKIVGEMERRYDLFSHTGTRNIEGYNQYLRRQNEELEEKNSLLPYIVVIVDELADLMMVASKDVEGAIMRIAQMARAAGIHLIIATQRPSVDVITGLIKANIPSRIAFAVSSQVDSRTILDSQGAEKLLGRGDMLFLPSGQSKPTRIQGAFLSDNEVEAVVDFVTKQQSANYIKEMEPDEVVKSDAPSDDELYFDAYTFVISEQKASASLLQRQFRIGYNRAARLVDDLEANQVIGAAQGSKPRQVLIKPEEEGGQ